MTGFERGFGRHPTATELLTYSKGELSEADGDEIQEHLVSCRACTRIVLDLAGEADPGDPVLAQFWESLKRSYEEGTQPAEVVAGDRSHGESRWPRLTAAAAAVLMLGSFAVGAILGSLGLFDRLLPDARRAAERARATQSVSSLDLVPQDYLRNGESTPTADGPADSYFLAFRLLVIDAESAGALKAEIRNASGSPVTEVADLLPGDGDRVEFLIPRQALEAGSYTLELFPAEGTRTEPIHSYRFAID